MIFGAKCTSCTSQHLQFMQQPDTLNSIMALRCVKTPEVRANSCVYTPESLSQTKTNTFVGFQDGVCCDCPVAFEVSHRFVLFSYSCSFFTSNRHGVLGRGVILAQCETKYELSIRRVNRYQHMSYIRLRPLRAAFTGTFSKEIFNQCSFCFLCTCKSLVGSQVSRNPAIDNTKHSLFTSAGLCLPVVLCVMSHRSNVNANATRSVVQKPPSLSGFLSVNGIYCAAVNLGIISFQIVGWGMG